MLGQPQRVPWMIGQHVQKNIKPSVVGCPVQIYPKVYEGLINKDNLRMVKKGHQLYDGLQVCNSLKP